MGWRFNRMKSNSNCVLKMHFNQPKNVWRYQQQSWLNNISHLKIVILCIILFCIELYCVQAATVFSNSLELCKEQCINRDIAIPLATSKTVWSSTIFEDCDYDCHIRSCQSGCQDLESFNSTCDLKCDIMSNAEVKNAESCRQGCRAVADIFLHQIQYLLNRISVEIALDPLQGIRLTWSFENAYSLTLQEISAANLQWVAQSRYSNTSLATFDAVTSQSQGWKWKNLDSKAFKDLNMQSTVFLSHNGSPEIQVRLAAIWRDTVVVSLTFSQSLLLLSDENMHSKLRSLPHAQLQLSSNSYALCWQSESRGREFHADDWKSSRFRLRLLPLSQSSSTNQAINNTNMDGTTLPTNDNLLSTTTTSTEALTTQRQMETETSRVDNFLHTEYTNAFCHLFRNLPLENCCRVAISEWIQNDTEPNDSASIEHYDDSNELVVEIPLRYVPEFVTNENPFIIFTNGKSLLVMENIDDFVLLTEPYTIPFELKEGVSITALASISKKKLLVGLSDGSIFVVDVSEALNRHYASSILTTSMSPKTVTNANTSSTIIEGSNETTTIDENLNVSNEAEAKSFPATRIRLSDDIAIIQIAVDEMQSRLYILRDKIGLTRCTSLENCDGNATILTTTNAQNSIQYIAVDSWNGFLYYATSSGDAFSTPLFPLDAIGSYSFSITRRLAELSLVYALEIDVAEQKLIAVLRNGSIFSRDLISDNIGNERSGFTSSDVLKAVTRVQFHKNRLYWISKSCGDSHPWDTCLYGEEFDYGQKRVHLNRYLYSGRTQNFVLMRDPYFAAFIAPPAKISFSISDTEARLNWKPPIPLPFQASGSSWRALSYEYTLSIVTTNPDDSQQIEEKENATLEQTPIQIVSGNVSSVNDVFLTLLSNNTMVAAVKSENNMPDSASNTIYLVSVRACTRGLTVCSTPIYARNRAFRAEEVLKKSVAFFTSDNDAKSLEPKLRPFNILGRELSIERFPMSTLALVSKDPTTIKFAYDNSTGVMYTTSQNEISIFRVLENGIRYRFLDFINVHQISVLPSRSIIIIASQYSIVMYRLTSSFENVIYNCISENCGEVVGMVASDDSVGRVFFFLRQANGEVELYQCSIDATEKDSEAVPKKIFTTKEFYAMRQMELVGERIVFLTIDGEVGTFDLKLYNWNFNIALRDVIFILSADWAIQNNRLKFRTSKSDAIVYDSMNGVLSWNVETTSPSLTLTDDVTAKRLLYKVELYRDSFGSVRTVSLTTQNQFTIPKSVLDAWNSRQVFDVQVDAISAWVIATANQTSLKAPTKPPSAPRNLRVYATQQKTVDGTRANIDLFWEEPLEWNGDMLGYVVNCTWENGSQLINESVSVRHSCAYSFTVKSGKLGCAVAASNEQGLIGISSERIVIDGGEFRPLIRLFAIDSTDSLVSIQNWTIPTLESLKGQPPNSNGASVSTILTKRSPRQSSNLIQYQTVTFVDNELYAIRKESDALFLVLLDINDISNVLYKGSLIGDFNGQIEAMTSDWVAYRLLLVANHEVLQISLHSLQQASIITPKRLFSLSLGAHDAKQLVFDPFANTAYLLTKNGSLFSLDLNRNGTESNLALELDCLKAQTVTSIVGQFEWNRAASPKIFALTWNGMIAIKTGLLESGNPGTKPISSSSSSIGVTAGTDTLTSDDSSTLSEAKNEISAEAKCSDVSINWTLFGGFAVVPLNLRVNNLEKGLKAILSFTVADKLFIFFTSSELLIYHRQSSLFSPVTVINPPLRQIIAASQSSQPFPDRSCFALPPLSKLNFTVRNEGRTGAVVEVNEQPNLYLNCPRISVPQTQYQIQFWRRGSDKVKLKNTASCITHIENGILDKETENEVAVFWYNRYSLQQPSNAKNGILTVMPPLEVNKLIFRTGYGFPTAPIEPAAYSLTPDTVLLYWKMPTTLNSPPNEIKYRIKQLSPALLSPVPIGVKQFESGAGTTAGDFSSLISDIVSCVHNPCRALIPNLRPSVDYQFWIAALHTSRLNSQLADDSDAISTEALVHNKDIPGILRLEDATSGSILLRWNWLQPQNEPSKVFVQYRQSGLDVSFIDLVNSSFDPTLAASVVRNITILSLKSATTYDYRFAAEYSGANIYDNNRYEFSELFYQQTQQAKTKAGTPSAPVNVLLLKEEDGWVLHWSPPETDGGEPVTSYAVEFRPHEDADWEIAERGIPPTRLSWRIGQLSIPSSSENENNNVLSTPASDSNVSNNKFNSIENSADLNKPLVSSITTDTNEINNIETVAYRVRAANSEGFGAYASTLSNENDLTLNGIKHGDVNFNNDISEMDFSKNLWIYLLLMFLLALSMAAIVIFLIARNRQLQRKRRKEKIHKIIHLENITNQIQFPLSPAHFPVEVENELRNLPRISQFCVKKQELLGKGSFGEVHKGIVSNPDCPGSKISVAIKYLKQSTDENRIKFLKEAILMNNFDHPNIVKLIGVQRDVEPHFLIIELMEGGDLHTFLNESRPHNNIPSNLCLKELISMMIDIGRGGAYLEAFKHVHRDLAARNCLISLKTSPQRVTKIADFGLARDIFNNDYYRIQGSDFLPLRWLAPESATDGVFTTKSDVWAFGIVLWEIMTLGQQPYKGINNEQVLARLRAGKALSCPKECPSEIFDIMSMAWTVDANKRPPFAELLPRLEALRGKQHLQSNEPFPPPTSGNIFENSLDSAASNGNAQTNTSCSTTNSSQSIQVPGGNNNNIGNVESEISGTSTPNNNGRLFSNRFDKSERSIHQRHNLGEVNWPPLLSSRSGKSIFGSSSSKPSTTERPSSTISGETVLTTVDYDYEIPRSRNSTLNRSTGCIDRGELGLSKNFSASLQPTLVCEHQPNSDSAYTNPAFVGSMGSGEESLTSTDNEKHFVVPFPSTSDNCFKEMSSHNEFSDSVSGNRKHIYGAGAQKLQPLVQKLSEKHQVFHDNSDNDGSFNNQYKLCYQENSLHNDVDQKFLQKRKPSLGPVNKSQNIHTSFNRLNVGDDLASNSGAPEGNEEHQIDNDSIFLPRDYSNSRTGGTRISRV